MRSNIYSAHPLMSELKQIRDERAEHVHTTHLCFTTPSPPHLTLSAYKQPYSKPSTKSKCYVKSDNFQYCSNEHLLSVGLSYNSSAHGPEVKMLAYRENPDWGFVDSPWDLLRDCHELRLANYSLDWTKCGMSHVLGVLSAYVFPFVGLIGLMTNFLIAYVIFFRLRRLNRQLIYLGSIACSDWITLFVFGWFWVFPAKGLPYASNGYSYYFTFNEGRLACKVHRYVYSFSSCLSSSLLLLTAVDRLLSIYFPLKFSRLSRQVAWKSVIITTFVSLLMMLPFAITVDHFDSQGRIICWLPPGQIFLQLYHVLFANASFFQTFAIIIVNMTLFFKLRKSCKLRETLTTSKNDRREIAASMTLLILSTVVVVCALPQTVAYMFAFVFQQTLSKSDSQTPLRFAFNIADIGWHLLFIQISTNFMLYMSRMQNFRKETLKFMLCGRWRVSAQSMDESFIDTRKTFISAVRNIQRQITKEKLEQKSIHTSISDVEVPSKDLADVNAKYASEVMEYFNCHDSITTKF